MSTDQALVLAGHGSHHDGRTAEPVHDHADRIRERGCFETVRPAFWKEQPSLAEVLATVEATTTYVVPLMTSEGYFVDEVFPRELGLEGDEIADRNVCYTDPVGTHERLVDVVIDRIRTVTDGRVDDADLDLALVGHGTPRHVESASSTVTQSDRLRGLDRFAAVEALFLDQAPHVGDLPASFTASNLVVVPLFIADGHHVSRDIPAAIGLPDTDEPVGGPYEIDGRQVWYTAAVGTAPSLTTVVLERAADAGADITPRSPAASGALSRAERRFLRWLEGGTAGPGQDVIARRAWGELAITVARSTRGTLEYTMCHQADRDVPVDRLDRLDSAAAVRTRTGTDGGTTHRPLRSAHTLPQGWILDGQEATAFIQAVRAVYPASIDLWNRERTDTLEVGSFEAVIARQSGRYRRLDAIDPTVRRATVEACCGACVRRPAWTAEPAGSAGGFPCPEPCSFLLEAARSFADTIPTESHEPPDPTVPAAAFDHPNNPTRSRFHEAATRSVARPPPKGGG